MTDKELVKCAKGAEAQLDGSAAKIVSAQKPNVSAKIVTFEFVPGWRLFPFVYVPLAELGEGLFVIALGVDGGASVGGEVGKKFLGPGVWFWLRGRSRRRSGGVHMHQRQTPRFLPEGEPLIAQGF